MAIFAANRHETVGLVSDREVAILRLLAPHIGRAVTIGDLMDLKKVEVQALGSTLDHLSAGVIVVAEGNRIYMLTTRRDACSRPEVPSAR